MAGKTVEEATEQALDQLGVAAGDAEVIVVDEPKTGLFGRVRVEATGAGTGPSGRGPAPAGAFAAERWWSVRAGRARGPGQPAGWSAVLGGWRRPQHER